jgi:hypothetical protein
MTPSPVVAAEEVAAIGVVAEDSTVEGLALEGTGAVPCVTAEPL